MSLNLRSQAAGLHAPLNLGVTKVTFLAHEPKVETVQYSKNRPSTNLTTDLACHTLNWHL
jgi:hypothetical protein